MAQAIALATHANAFLRGRHSEPTELLGTHSTFRTTYEINFERPGPGGRLFALAGDPIPWLRKLQKEEVSRMRLVLTPWTLDKATRMANRFEPRWGLVTEGDVGTELWEPNWSIRPGINPKVEAAPWIVRWQSERTDRATLRFEDDGEAALHRLVEAMKSLTGVVRALGGELEKATFASLLESAVSPKSVIRLGQFPDLFEESIYSKQAARTGLLCSVAVGLFISAGWKERSFDSDTVQQAFKAARQEYWTAAVSGLQAAVNTLAD